MPATTCGSPIPDSVRSPPSSTGRSPDPVLSSYTRGGRVKLRTWAQLLAALGLLTVVPAAVDASNGNQDPPGNSHAPGQQDSTSTVASAATVASTATTAGQQVPPGQQVPTN